jgi:hypothetical protein
MFLSTVCRFLPTERALLLFALRLTLVSHAESLWFIGLLYCCSIIVALLAFVLLTILDSGLMRPAQGFAVQRMTLRVSLAPLV